MLATFVSHIESEFPYLKTSRLLVAVSGGIDSVVLTHLLYESGCDIALAHVNFGLRNRESDADETFVRALAEQYKIPVFVHSPETEIIAKTYRQSIQTAAREIRYEWFRSLLDAEQYDYLLTAHHLDDSIESFFINIGRRTGIRGMTGIPAVNGRIIRPLLIFTRRDIVEYAAAKKLQWREDSSNSKREYTRNRIRHILIPALENAMPDYRDALREVMKHTGEAVQLIHACTGQMKSRILREISPGEAEMNIRALTGFPGWKSLLYELLKDYGFTAWDDIYALPYAQSGKTVFSATHKLIKGREKLYLSVLNTSEKHEIYIVKGQKEFTISFGGEIQHYHIDMYPVPENFSPSGNAGTALLDKDSVSFPLHVRNWRKGDFFYPLGMNAKVKLSNFFINSKIPVHRKENIPLLCDRTGNVIWVMGMRLDERYKITDKTRTIIEITKQ